MLDDVGCDEVQSVTRSDDRLDPCPTTLGAFRLRQLLAFGDLGHLGVDLGPCLVGKSNLGEPRFVVNADGGTVLDGTGEVIDVDVVPEDLPGGLIGYARSVCR